METTERDGLDNMDWTEVHLDCRAGREEKSVAERSRKTVEKQALQRLRLEPGCKGGRERLL